MTTLREQIDSDVGDVFLNTDDFAETCVYLPRSGGARPIVCIVEEDAQQVDEHNNVILAGSIHVFTSRSATTGINAPEQGDKLCREHDRLAGGIADPSKCYSYSGVVDESDDATASAWTLVFVRNQPTEIGGNRR